MQRVRTCLALAAVTFVMGIGGTVASAADEYTYDGVHSSIGFKARHLDISWIHGRFNEAEGAFQPDFQVDDRLFVQCMTALRLFLPRAGMTISTRESAAFRDRILPLGATRYSAASSTGVGGYAVQAPEQTPQFEITDTRSVDEVAAAIAARGYQPVFKDWDSIA